MGKRKINISKSELDAFGKASSLFNGCFIVINKAINIEHINDITLKLLNIDNKNNVLGQSFISIWEQTKFPAIIDSNGKLICKKPILINDSFKKWKKQSVLIDGNDCFFLIGEDVSEIELIKKTVSDECKKITGHHFNAKLATTDYINEIYNYLTNIINKIPCYIYWKNTDLQYIGCNQMAADFINYQTTQEIIGKNDLDIFTDSDLAKSYQNVDRHILTSDQPITNEPGQLINHKGETLHTLVSKVPLKDLSGKIIGLVGITVDVTELKKAKEAAEAANHSKTEFIANMSHDIRTPLTGVVGMSHMLEDSVTDAKQKSYAHMLGESGDQLLHMLNGILDVVSADNVNENDVHEEPFSLNRMIQDILELERPTTLVKGLGLNTQIDEAIPPCVVSDHTKIHRILLNLLGNAVKFTKEGYVEIGAKLLTCDKEQALIQFHVKDTGIGIPFELQDKVFDRFFRVTPSYKGIYTGHGVGLHIAQSYAHLLGGNILLTSEPNVGTTFYFDLSLRIGDPALLPSDPTRTHIKTPDPIPVEPLVDTNTSLIQSNAPMLLLVEDNAIALTILENLVTKGGCNFMHAIDGLEALMLATTHDFDAIITDLGLPGLSGIEFTQKLRAFEREQHKPPTPIIGLTAHADVKAKNDCIQSGMNDTYTKPLPMDALDNIKSTYLALNNQTPNAEKNTEKAAGDIINNRLPDTEEALFELRKLPCLDPNVGINILGSIEPLNKALTSLAQKNIPNDLDEIKRAHLLGDWATVERIAHRMRGGFVYTGNVKLSTACQYLENYHKAGHTIKLEALYQQVLDVSNETLVTINRWLSMQ